MNQTEQPNLVALNAIELNQIQGGFPVFTSLWPLTLSCVVKVIDEIGPVCEPVSSSRLN